MSKNTKGLGQDSRPQDQPADVYYFGKNGIQANLKGAIENEPGFVLSQVRCPYGPPNGIIPCEKHPIIFSTNNVNSAIGYYDEVNDVYIPALDDANLSFKLGFNSSHYITGQAQRNYKGEVVVAFTDKNDTPKYLNMDNPEVKAPEDLLLFPLAQAPDIAVVQDVGGTLLPGSYFAAVRFLKNDGTQTAFLVVSNPPTIIGGIEGTPQNVSLVITLTNVDPNYDIAEIAIIQKVGGVFAANLLDQVQLAPVTVVTYTGSNPTTAITLDEVLQNPVVYEKIGTMGQLNDYLYNGDLTGVPEIAMQPYANLVKVKWVSESHSVFPADPVITTGEKKGFMHREVACLYIQFSLNTGGWSRAFHLPGRAILPSDLLASAIAATGAVTAKVFQVEDTIPDFDPVSKTGSMGAWENQDETYPATDDYNSSAIGGEDLRGKNVRHHRMPSLRWCKQNLYNLDTTYGRTTLDILGLNISNVIIPTQYAGIITGYRILYAQRNLGNSTVIAQAQYLNAGRPHAGATYSPTLNRDTGGDTNYLSTGGNWRSFLSHAKGADNRPIYSDYRLVRFHAFDLLFNQPAITPSYICNELLTTLVNLGQGASGFMINNGSISPGTFNGPLTYLADYITKGTVPQPSADAKMIRAILNSTYVPANLINGPWTNTMQETCFGMVCGGPEVLHVGTTPNSADDPTSEYSMNRVAQDAIFGAGAIGESYSDIPQFEKTYLTNLMYLRDNLYVTFTSQTLVIANSRVAGSAPTTIFGGDTFINDYTFHTYGWVDSANDGFTHFGQALSGGVRIARRIACEAASNINLRTVTPGNQYSEWYPKQSLVVNATDNYLTLFDRTQDPNQFGYNKDLNALNGLVSSAIFDPLVEVVTDFPYRIHRSGKLGRLDKRRSWRTFDPLDFYEMQKNKGLMVNLAGQDDRLLIHMEKALFLTQDRTQLESNVLSITLSAGDIFQFEPQESLASQLGYAGTQHDLACVQTNIGYLFVDSLEGQVFLFKGKLRLLNEFMNTFFRKYARLTDKNPFLGNGYTIGYDPVYKRILLTAKNVLSQQAVVQPYQATQAFIDTLTPGVSIVYKEGRLQRFLGVNTSTQFSCDQAPLPSIANSVISVADNTAIGVQVLQLGGSNIANVFILSGNTGQAWALSADGKLSVNGPLSFPTLPQYILNCTAVGTDGQNISFTITINLVASNKPPVAGDQTVHIPQFAPNGSAVAQVLASDPNGLPLSYAIASGNTGGAFTINSSGQITVLDTTQLDITINNSFTLMVAVSNPNQTVDCQITIIVDYVNTPPSSADVVLTINDTTPVGTSIGDLSKLVFDLGVAEGVEVLTFQQLAATVPGAFDIDAATGLITSAVALSAAVTPQYIINMQATDNGNPPLSSTFRLIINVIYDPASLSFVPAGDSCTGSSCAPGYVLSPDGTQCVQTTTINATAPSGPTIGVTSAVNNAYSNFGILAYNAGYAINGTGVIGTQINASPWNNPLDNLIDGALNRCGVWGTTAVPVNQPIGFSIPVFFATAKTLLIGIGGDNKVQISLDGTILVDQDPTAMAASISAQLPVYATQGIAVAFKMWHVYAIVVPAGNHYIGLQGVNFGGAAGFGAEIYDNTVADLAAATLQPAYIANPGTFPIASNHYTNLNLIFSTRSARGGTFTSGVNNAYSCPATYGLDPTQTPPKCILQVSVPAVANAKHWANVSVVSSYTGGQVALLTNMVGQTFQGIPVPFYADVPGHVDCGGTISTFLNVQKSGGSIRNNCPAGQNGSLVLYYVQAGRYMSIVSQADADAQAQNDVTTNVQTYANSNGTCTVNP